MYRFLRLCSRGQGRGFIIHNMVFANPLGQGLSSEKTTLVRAQSNWQQTKINTSTTMYNTRTYVRISTIHTETCGKHMLGTAPGGGSSRLLKAVICIYLFLCPMFSQNILLGCFIKRITVHLWWHHDFGWQWSWTFLTFLRQNNTAESQSYVPVLHNW